MEGPFFVFGELSPGEELLVNLRGKGRGLTSADKRDRLFALVGLSSDTDSSVIDYERDYADTLRLITRKEIENILTGPNPSEVFDYLSMVHKYDSDDGLSSWVPTFGYSFAFTALGAIFQMKNPLKTVPHVTFKDSKVCCTDFQERTLSVWLTSVSKSLQVKGRIIDYVKRILNSEVASRLLLKRGQLDSCEVAKMYRENLSFMSDIWKLATLQSTGEDLDDVLWRSIAFDTLDPYVKAPADMRKGFESYLQAIALTTVCMEYVAGDFSHTSVEEVAKEVQGLIPQMTLWPAFFKWVHADGFDMWTQIANYIAALGYLHELMLKSLAFERSYFASKLGYLGWVPCHAQEGDQICAFYGSRYPFVIRPCVEGFLLIGACYMQGLMEGEGIELPNQEGDGDMIITLV